MSFRIDCSTQKSHMSFKVISLDRHDVSNNDGTSLGAAASASDDCLGNLSSISHQLPGASVQGSQRVPQEGDGADRGAQARAVPHVHQPAERRDAPLTGWKPLTKDNSSSSSNNNNNRNIGRRRRRGGNRTRRGARRGGKKITEGESWRRRVRRA